jgi:hypothetical protein
MKTLLVLFVAAASAWAQPPAGERVNVPFSDPSRPGQLKVSLIQGSVTVKAYNGKEVIIETGTPAPGRPLPAPPPGMRRIVPSGSGLDVEEANNVMTVSVGPPMHPVNLTIQAPANTSLKLNTVSGAIRVEGMQGEIEADSTNGPVTLANVSGSAVAHALNGRVEANFLQVNPQKPMSFSSLNGTIDVTFPADLKANVKMRSDNGEILSDFDIVTRPGPGPVVESNRAGGRYRVRMDRTVYGTINGGGPEIQFSNFNGSIYIRKAK